MNPGQYKVCPQCHQHVPIDALHCLYCGHAFRTQFVQPQPQYPPPNVVYVPVPMGTPGMGQPYPAPRQNRQSFVKWLIGLTIFAILGVAAYSVIRTKLSPSGSPASSAGTPIVPTSLLDEKALSNGTKVLIHWEKTENGRTLADVTNEGPQPLPNLYLQFVLLTDSSGGYSQPIQVQYGQPGQAPQDEIPSNVPVPFTLPFELSQLQRMHAYFIENTPAGPVQYGIEVEQTQDRD